jgi:PAS domain S-box-containing protein
MLLVRPDTGRVIASSRHSPPPDVDISGRDYMRAEPSGPSGVMVGEVIRPTSSGTLGFTVGRRDPFSGLLAVSLISVENFASFYAPQRAAPQDLLVLMREDGVILAGDVGGPYAVGLRSPELAASVVGKARRPMQVLHSQLDGVPRLLDGRRVGDYPVYVAYGLPASVLHAAWLRQTGPVALWALLSSGLLLYLVFRAQRAAQGTRQAEVAAQAARLRAVNAEALASNEERLRIALEGARLGLFERDLRSGIGHWDERTRDLLAVGREWRSNSRTDWLGRIHPEDRARVQAAFAAAAKGERIFDPEYRVLLAGGGVRWIGSRAEVQRSPEGEPTRLVGVVFDITERKDAEEKLRDSEATFRAMFAISSVGKAHADVRSGRFLRVNAALCSITGYSEQELLQCSLLDIVHPAERASEAQGLARLTNNSAPAHDVETRYLHKGGGIVWVHVTANVIPDRSGRPSRLTAIIQDITERKRAEEELRSATRQLDLAQQAGKVAAWEYVPGIDTAVWSQAMCELLGLDPARPPSLKMFREHVHPDDRDRLDRARAAEAAAPHGTESTIELRLLPSGGGTIWAERRSRVVIEKGERRVVGANIDLTARKRAEDHKTLLLNELNHRVKNTLATVQSIAMQTFRGGELNAQQVQAFQGRLLALAAAHDVLTRESWEGADLHDVVSQAVAPHRGEDAARIRIEGPSVRLQPKPALAVAMGLHELCTNAAKYGALSQTGGCVSISWTLANGSGPPRLRLQWRESGGPAVKRPRRPGFGSRLIGTLLAEDLDAEIALDYPPTGCVCTIDAPLSTPAGEQGKA